MKTWEMIKFMSRNLKRKAKDYKIGNTLQWHNGQLQYPNGTLFTITKTTIDYDWEIIEPEPELVDFTEAYRQYRKYKIIKSVVTDRLYLFPDKLMSFVPINEVDGKWIISED